MIAIEHITENIIRIVPPEKLQAEDFAQMASQIDSMIRQHGHIRLLVDGTLFNGWANMAAFEKHMSFVTHHHKKVERIAVLAGHSWHHWLIGVFKLFVHPEIQVFDTHESEKALAWLKR